MQPLIAPSRSRVLVGVTAVAILALLAIVPGCRGTRTSEPPIHWMWNMDFQQYYRMQEEDPYFKDHRAMRLPVPGTVARPMHLSTAPGHDDAHLQASDPLYRGRDGREAPGYPHGKLITGLPPQIKLTKALLDRGRARYDIYCTACHGPGGDGKGVVVDRGVMPIPPPTYFSARLRAMPLGYIFNVITDGFPAKAPVMEPYAAQVPVHDRWAIAAWVRTLQISESARLADIPGNVAQKHRWGAK